jgi:exodeoxyribonuclease V gamma subunit
MRNDPLRPGLMVIHGNRPEVLRDLLSTWMQRYRIAPLASETILVQSNGIAQWLKIALARDEAQGGCGISAGLDMLLPAKFLWRTFRAVLGANWVPEVSALDRQPLTWRLMRLIPRVVDQPDFAALRRFLLDDPESRKRLQLAQRLADLFDQYQVYRADWLEDWAQGRDQLRRRGGGHTALAPEERWQAQLWRAVLADIGAPAFVASRGGVHQRFVQRLNEASQRPAGLPERVIVFGISSMPAQALQALSAIARHAQVLLCVHNPCRHYWADIVTDKDLLRQVYQRQQRWSSTWSVLDENTLHQHAHPLLAAWGRQGRDYISLLDYHNDPSQYHSPIGTVIGDRIDLFEADEPNSLLRQLQDDILEQRSLHDTRSRWTAIDMAADTSIRMHSVHSTQREVEVLHDQLLARFDTDPTLRPRDVIVMTPDINAYAPYIDAVFGLPDRADIRHIPYAISDQRQRGHDPLYIALEHLLNLPTSRWAVSEVMDLLDVASVRRRFGIAVADLPLLHRWIEGSGIRWGLDGRQRERLGLPAADQANSWQFGLSRMLLGFAVGRGEAWDGIEPYDEIGGLDAVAIGPMWSLVRCLAAAADAMGQPATADEWVERLSKLIDDFFAMQDAHELGQRLDWLRQLDAWRDDCLRGGLDQPLPLAVVREAWLSGMDADGLNQRFLSGAVSFCTLMPMRAIPFKVVCLLGMNDKDFPRRVDQVDFDLMQHDYRPGDRSRRDDDHYLLLEVLLSAREQLYISWVGRNPRDNAERPPSVLIGQLRDHLDAGWRLQNNVVSVSAALTHEHSLQPFSAQYFPLAAKQGLDEWFTYSPAWRAMHESTVLQTAVEEAPLVPVNSTQTISLTDVDNFLKQPVNTFFRDRLGVRFSEQQLVSADHEVFALDGLEAYGIYHVLYERLLPQVETGLRGEDLSVAIRHNIARLRAAGVLPSAAFGELSAQALAQPAQHALDAYAALVDVWGERSAMPALFEYTDSYSNVTISDMLTGLRHAQGQRACLYLDAGKLHRGTRLRWDRLVRYWARHLALQQLGMPADSIIVGQTGVVTLAAMPMRQALDTLQRIIALRAEGLTRPLPIACRSAFDWLDGLCDQSLRAGSNALSQTMQANAQAAAQITYEGGYNIDGEMVRSVALRRAYPRFDLMWQGGFEQYAQALYGPLHGWINRRPAVVASVGRI